MSTLAIADATTVTRPAPARSGRATRSRDRDARLRPVPDVPARDADSGPLTAAPSAPTAVPSAPTAVPSAPTAVSSAPTAAPSAPAAGPATSVAAPVESGVEVSGAAPFTLTIRIEGGGRAGRERVLTALRDLVTAAGPAAAVLVEPDAAADATGSRDGDAQGGAIRLDPRPRTVVRDGWPLRLSRLEYDLLLFLARHPRQVFSRTQLLAQVWGHTHTTNRTVDVHVSRLRHKLGDQDLVATVYGLGYRLADDAQITVAE